MGREAWIAKALRVSRGSFVVLAVGIVPRLTNSGFGVQLRPSYETVSIKKGGGQMTKVYCVEVVGLGAGLARRPLLEGWGA